MQQTLTGLRRWSSINGDLPAITNIKRLHIYDFDNTLFKSPLPNPRLWHPSTFSQLQNQDAFTGGGWWHDVRILEATGQGLALEEPRAWQGWWNETIVDLARLSIQQPDTLTVLLTGRGERNFATLITRMAASKHLAFNMICLKPEVSPDKQRFSSTLRYKQAVFQDLMQTYHFATEITIYEDRPRQIQGFREFFVNYNQARGPSKSPPIKADVIQVCEQATKLDPMVEAAEVQRMINDHKLAEPDTAKSLTLTRVPHFTAYIINPADTSRLLELVKVPPNMAENNVNRIANHIMIAPGQADSGILEKIGGMGAKMTWQVTGLAYYQCCIWAARVAPIPTTAVTHTFSHTPLIVLATNKDTRQDLARQIQVWQPVPPDKRFILQTIVGEKVQLRIESDRTSELDRKRRREHENSIPNKSNLRPSHRPRFNGRRDNSPGGYRNTRTFSRQHRPSAR